MPSFNQTRTLRPFDASCPPASPADTRSLAAGRPDASHVHHAGAPTVMNRTKTSTFQLL
jgi:hypothetical protein